MRRIVIQDHKFFLEDNDGKYFQIKHKVSLKHNNKIIYTFIIDDKSYIGETIEEVNRQLTSDDRDNKLNDLGI